jgi:hypothetical protein
MLKFRAARGGLRVRATEEEASRFERLPTALQERPLPLAMSRHPDKRGWLDTAPTLEYPADMVTKSG